MQYRYFVDFRHAISVFTNFSYGIAVLGTPNIPLHMYIEYRLLPEVDLKKSSLCSLCWLLLCPVLFPPTHPPIPTAMMMTTINLTTKKKTQQEQIGPVSDLSGRSRWLDVLAKFFHLAPQRQTNKQTNKHDKNKGTIHPPIRSERDWSKRDLHLYHWLNLKKNWFLLQKQSAKSKAGLPILANN